MPCPSPKDLLDPGIELGSPALQADSLPSELSGKPESSINGGDYFIIIFIYATVFIPVARF